MPSHAAHRTLHVPNDEPTQPAGEPNPSGSKPKPGSGSRPLKDLIADAIQQASPKSGSKPGMFAGDLPSPDAFQGYEVLREIHRGGQGVVYQAIQNSTKRKVAIKLLHGGPFTGSTGRSRFEREVQVLGQLNHPNIVRIHDSGATADGSFFYVMDYISGRSLDELVTDKKLGVDETLRLFGKICDAVNAAHLKGIIHRDLKPSNVRVDANGEPIVVDFGLAKIAVGDMVDEPGSSAPHLMTLTGQFVGSLPWASPEQAEGHPGNIDVRTDVYSLGVMLYQMLTGQFPYKVLGNMRDVLDNILRAEPERPSTIRRQVDDEVETIVLKCLSKERERRYQSAGELGRDIKRYLGGEPIEAKRDSTAYMLGKAFKRYRVPVAVGVTLVLMLAVFSVAMTVMYRQASRAEHRAKDALAAATEAEAAQAAQRARAEANFHAGHDLAMVMITSINDELTYLRGATRARELVLKEAKSYLDKLRTEAGDDPNLLLDLASAHERVGDLQGVIYMRRLGETGEAEKNHARAREIRDALLARFPDQPRMHAAVARSLYRAGGAAQLRGKLPDAQQHFAAAVAAYDRALATPPADPLTHAKWQDSRAWTLRALADILRLDARAAAAAGDESTVAQLIAASDEQYLLADAAWRAILASGENEDARRGLGVVADCRALLSMVRAQLASTLAKRAATAGDRAAAAAGYTSALTHIARAREAHERTLAEFRGLAAANTVSGEIRRHELVTTRYLALTRTEEARIYAELKVTDPSAAAREASARDAAIAAHQEAVRIARRLGDEDTRSVEARRDLTGCVLTLATELSAVGRTADAAAAFDEVVALRREIAKADPMERHELDLAVALLRLAEFRLDHPGSQTPGPAELLDQSAALLAPLKDRSAAGVDAYIAEIAKLRARVR